MSGTNNASSFPAPPQHPHTTSTTGTTTTTNDGSAGAGAAQELGDKIKGGWNVFHGAGEGIRGNVNSFLDNVGEQIAGRGDSTTKPVTRTEGGNTPAHVAASGADELRAGMNQLQK